MSRSATSEVYIISADKKFARMLQLALEKEKIKAITTVALPKKRCIAVIDLDSAKPQTANATITFSRDESLIPTFVRPFDVSLFVREVKNLCSAGDETEDFKLSGDSIIYGSVIIPLSDIEYTIFSMLYEKRGETVTLEEINDRVWNGDGKGNSAVVYINYLRKKIDFRFGKHFIITVRGRGYMLAESEEVR